MHLRRLRIIYYISSIAYDYDTDLLRRVGAREIFFHGSVLALQSQSALLLFNLRTLSESHKVALKLLYQAFSVSVFRVQNVLEIDWCSCTHLVSMLFTS